MTACESVFDGRRRLQVCSPSYVPIVGRFRSMWVAVQPLTKVMSMSYTSSLCSMVYRVLQRRVLSVGCGALEGHGRWSILMCGRTTWQNVYLRGKLNVVAVCELHSSGSICERFSRCMRVIVDRELCLPRWICWQFRDQDQYGDDITILNNRLHIVRLTNGEGACKK